MKIVISLPIANSTLFEEANPKADCMSAGCGTAEYQFPTIQDAEEAKKAYFKRLDEEIVIGIIPE